MTLWEFSACIDGWNACHGGEGGDKAKPPTEEEFDEMKRLHGDD